MLKCGVPLTHLWAGKFDRAVVELFETQDEVVRAVAAYAQLRLIINKGDRAEADMMWTSCHRRN